MSRVAIIDTDILIYAAASAAQEAYEWDQGLWSWVADEERAKKIIREKIREVSLAIGADECVHTISDADDNFRKHLPIVQYKQNRLGQKRPLLWKRLREWAQEELGAVVYPGLEGDDVCALFSTTFPWDGGPQGEPVVCSIDKDFRTVPGLIYNWDVPQAGVEQITEESAWRYHLTQTISGDRVDGYNGVPGLGDVRARRLIDAASDPFEGWQVVVAAYQKAKLNEDVALANARCAWILRGDDYNFETGEIRLWTPPLQ